MAGFVGGCSIGSRPVHRMRSQICMVRAGKLRTGLTKMDNVIDDLQNKRLGRGYVFYGERKGGTEILPQEELDVRENAVLVTGATGEVGSWVVICLLNAGINVRVLTRRADEAERMFGLDGSNVDVFVGDIRKEADVREAVEGASAIVCASGSRNFIGANTPRAVDLEGTKRLIRIAEENDIRKFVLVSCNVGNTLFGNSLQMKREAEDALLKSKLSHCILRTGRMNNTPGRTSKVKLAPSSESTEQVSTEDVANVITHFLEEDAEYLFGEDDQERSEKSKFGNFVADLYNTQESPEEEPNWNGMFQSVANKPQ